MTQKLHPGQHLILEPQHVPHLITALQTAGYTVVGPTVRDHAIVYDTLHSAADLPIGWTDEQERGRYQLKRREDDALFGYVLGPQSWKRFLYPPRVTLWRATANNDGLAESPDAAPPRYAFLGVRPCELAAIAIQDRIFLGGSYIDPIYQARREGVFIVAVNCGLAGATCFCVSMDTGPVAHSGFDLALTEVLTPTHYLLVTLGTPAGAAIMAQVAHRPAGEEEIAQAEAVSAATAAHMGRQVETAGLKELLYDHLRPPNWESAAQRCLSCTNCTLVCPTCFCAAVEDVTSLTGHETERVRLWDSCFNLGYSYIHGGPIRSSVRARYRQWATHKFAYWIDQFGMSGCVGCGRCITWCPAAIDITEELAAIRQPAEQES